ncbi:beta-galactosidase GalA [Flavobacterium aurantiibacter]|uniref:Glycoside hydrolase family 2 n=1 Tax=Flavobacterium aurantiibacter TaxID=2023067 RepID=A0A255ZQC0_9FLAO|nr:beta-galactosidase GalA [Flavobacterium aurantiibacter]OYQ43767.1 glycoside hydrolase family 2 [Flavobacterium aurantiibacter]
MSKLSSIVLLFTVLTWTGFSQKRTSLDDDWRFHFGHAANAEKDFNYSIATIFSKSGGAAKTAIDPKFVDTTWTKVQLPHDWAVKLPFVYSDNFDVISHGFKPVGGLYLETSIGWYRKRFQVSNSSKNNRFEIQFDGVFRNASVWLNGFYLGTNQSGYLGFSYDVTDYLKYGEDNVLVVRVDATQYEGWFYEGAGIYRRVWLHETNKLHIPQHTVFVTATPSGRKANVSVALEVENKNLTSDNCSVYTYITDRNGKELTRSSKKNLQIGAPRKTDASFNLTLNNCTRWDLENPYLYRAVVVVEKSGQKIHQEKVKFGIRSFEFDVKKGFSLNGKRFKIKGTNNHQDHAGVGAAMPDDLQYYRIRLLKEMGSNAYRASHNAPTPELLEACDSLGMLVVDEQRLLNSSPEYLDQFERLIKRDRNHPSVILWSIGNEEGWIQKTETGKKIAQTLLTQQKIFDPTRTSTYAADMPNEFNGVNEVIPIRGFNYRQNAVADYHRDHPNQPLIGTEMGSTVTTRGIYEADKQRAYVPDQDITAPWWASRAEEWWVLAAENDFWLGGFIWTGFDYRGEPTPYQWPNVNSHFGVMDVCGFPKNIYYYYKSWWTDEDVLHISPHWNWPDKVGQDIDVWVNSNADEVELFLNNKSLGKQVMPRNRHLKWKVPYQAGTLEAVAIKKGKTIRAQVKTTDTPFAIKLAPSVEKMRANGTDLAIINVSVVDKNGLEVPVADNVIKFRVSENAKILGVGNGDPSSHEPDQCAPGTWQRSAFNGKCQLIIQAGKTAGDITVEAYSNTLQTTKITLKQLP